MTHEAFYTANITLVAALVIGASLVARLAAPRKITGLDPTGLLLVVAFVGSLSGSVVTSLYALANDEDTHSGRVAVQVFTLLALLTLMVASGLEAAERRKP